MRKLEGSRGTAHTEIRPPLVSPQARRVLRTTLDYVARQLRHLSGALEGLSYRTAGRHPDADVTDDVLADRVRSVLGPLEKRLDLPHVNVMVEDHAAVLHGVVGSDHDMEQIVDAVLDVPGVRSVDCWLHVGLGPGDTRPSEGRAVPTVSAARERLLEAAIRAGVPEPSALDAVRAVLGTFADRLPEEERDHVAHHLPADVRPLFEPPRRIAGPHAARRAAELIERVCATSEAIPTAHADAAVENILAALRSLVPEESRDVAAVLPRELRDLWVLSVPG